MDPDEEYRLALEPTVKYAITMAAYRAALAAEADEATRGGNAAAGACLRDFANKLGAILDACGLDSLGLPVGRQSVLRDATISARVDRELRDIWESVRERG